MNKLILLFIILSSSAFANYIDDKCPQFAYVQAPQVKDDSNVTYLCRENYAVEYNNITKTPMAVLEHLTRDDLLDKVKRTNDFRSDKTLPVEARSILNDYKGSGYDKGHMNPANDNTQNIEVMSQTFLLSNIVPQNPNNNRGMWKKLETLTRNYVKNNEEAYIISGSIYRRGYKTIGNKVGVPTDIFKIVITQDKYIAFMMPNAPVSGDLSNYIVPLNQIQKYLDIDIKVPAYEDIELNNWK